MRRMLPLSLAVLLLGAVPLAAQGGKPPIAVTNQGVGKAKSPTAARFIGIIPGAGHVYAGETSRGLAYFGGIVALGLVGGMALAVDCLDELAEPSDSCGSKTGENLLTAAILGVWGWSIYDAGRAAERTNRAHGLRTALILAPARSSGVGHGGRGVKIGLSFAGR